MEILNPTIQKIMTFVLRQITEAPTIATLAETFNMSHVGVWKAVKGLEEINLIKLKSTGKKKNSTFTIHINWNNSLVEKTLVLALTHEVANQQRWVFNFAELEKEVEFLILYGSILHSPKEANDVDIISVVSNSKNFIKINKSILKIQMLQSKKVHAINFISEELKKELRKENRAFLDAFKNGVVLFGQNKFVSFIKELNQ
ncbi:MAG: hypothetical protein AABW80_04585 [Nanoarchaeota archaeon]